ncbi:hypothetical protein QQF64_009596 [Cirrhinus molitorella]|uniref:Uncharacterized protein n=1 Tax=Cirrhinus molitorella TaxID=172907 RepID=A0ABR3M509_9TELE
MKSIIQVLEANLMVVGQLYNRERRTATGNFSIDAVDDVWWCVMSISSIVAQRVKVISPSVNDNACRVSCEFSDDLMGVACCATSLCSDFLVWEDFLRVQTFSIRVHEEENILGQVLEVGQVELEAVEKQIRQLLERQAELRAALESSRDALFPDVLHSGARTPRTLGAAAAEDASQATDEDLSPPLPPVFEISTRNRFAPLRETERDAVIVGDSIVRYPQS